MRTLFFNAEPYDRAQVTRALESGADGIIAPPENAVAARALARCRLINAAELTCLTLASKRMNTRPPGF